MPILFCLLLAAYTCTEANGGGGGARPRRIPISSYNRNSDFTLIHHMRQPFDQATYNRTKELCEKINKVLEPHRKNRLVTIPELQQFFQDPTNLRDMTFFSLYDSYESVNFTDARARGLALAEVHLNNVGVPSDDATQVHIHIYVTMSRLEVFGNFTLAPASSNLLKSGPFNFTVIDLLAVGTLKISQDENGLQRTLNPYLPIQQDDMHLNLENVTFETEFLKYEIFDTIEPQLREQVRRLFTLFADKLIEKIQIHDQNIENAPSSAKELSDWGNALRTNTISADPVTEPGFQTVDDFLGPGSVVRSVPKSSYSPAMPNASTTDVKEATASYDGADALCENIKKALAPYNKTRGVVTMPGPPFFRDPARLRDAAFSSRYDYETANFTDIQVHGMANFTVNVNWFGFFNARMPVHVHMFLRTTRLEVLGNYTLLPDSSSQLVSGPFNLTVDDMVPYGILEISQDEYGYHRTAIHSDTVGHKNMSLDLDGYVFGTNCFLKYELFLAVQSHFSEQVRLFFLRFGDTLIDQLKVIDKDNEE